MNWFEKYTAFAPVQTITTTSTSIRNETITPRCFGCKFSYMSATTLLCACASRTVKRTMTGDECVSYRARSNE